MSRLEAPPAPPRWLASLVDAVRRIFAFNAGPGTRSTAAPARAASSRARGDRRASAGRTHSVRALAAQGLTTADIARRTRLSQDAVTMLLNLAPRQPVESAAEGTFFRILQARTAA